MVAVVAAEVCIAINLVNSSTTEIGHGSRCFTPPNSYRLMAVTALCPNMAVRSAQPHLLLTGQFDMSSENVLPVGLHMVVACHALCHRPGG